MFIKFSSDGKEIIINTNHIVEVTPLRVVEDGSTLRLLNGEYVVVPLSIDEVFNKLFMA